VDLDFMETGLIYQLQQSVTAMQQKTQKEELFLSWKTALSMGSLVKLETIIVVPAVSIRHKWF
jgi:hypothetical protein